MERQIELQPFLGVVTSVDGTLIPQANASDCLNVRLEDGRIKPRYGWRQLQSGSGSGFTSSSGLCFVRGYDSSGTELAEYVSFETRSGNLRPYSVHATTGVRSAITDGGSTVNLSVGEWNAIGYDSYAYAHQVGGSVYRHEIGDSTSWEAVDATAPPAPSTAPSVEFEVTEEENTAATTFNWDGLAGITNNGGGATNVSFVSVSSHNVNLDFPTVSGVDLTIYDFTLDMNGTTAGIQDWSAVSFIEFSLSHSLSGNNGRWALLAPYDSNIVVKLINNDGSPITVTMDTEVERKIGTDTITYKVKASFPSSATMTDWDNTRKIWLFIEDSYPNHATQNVRFALSPVTPNTATDVDPSLPDSLKIRFGYAYYDSERDIESGTVKESRWYRMGTADTQRYYKFDGDQEFLGNLPTVTVTTLAQDNVDQYRLYVWFEDTKVWQLIDTYDLSDLSQEVDLSFTNLRALPSRRYRAYTPIGGSTLWIGTYGGSLVYLKQSTEDNIKVSFVGNATRLADPNYDLDTDLTRGRTMTMSPSFDDIPRCCFEADRSLIVLGDRGAYASVGDGTPSSLTTPRRLPNSKGVLAMRCACRYRSDDGLSGVAYIGTDTELYFVAALPQFNGEQGFRMEEVTREVRGLISSFLLASASPNLQRIQIGVDERSDSLWLLYNDRAMVLRRPSVIDGQRHWELYQYDNTTGWLRFCLDTYYGIRGIRSDGSTDEFEYDASNAWQGITGSTRDNGSAITNGIYWTSKTFHDISRRWYTVQVERSTMADTVSVTIVSDRATTTKTVATLKHNVKFGVGQQGFNHKVKLTLSTSSSPIGKVIVTERYPSGRRLAA